LFIIIIIIIIIKIIKIMQLFSWEFTNMLHVFKSKYWGKKYIMKCKKINNEMCVSLQTIPSLAKQRDAGHKNMNNK